jgi:AbrB family looped-hinge helix DNA binding protein
MNILTDKINNIKESILKFVPARYIYLFGSYFDDSVREIGFMSEVMIVSTKGQITLPSRVRAKFGIKAGDKVIGEYLEDGFVIKKPLDLFSRKGCLAGGKMPADEEDLLNRNMGRMILDRI